MGCPNFEAFVTSVADGDISLYNRIWEVLGYYLTQDQRGKCFAVIQGPHDSGKSLFGNFLRNSFNKEAVSSLDLHSFGRTFAVADLIGKRLCIDLDLPAGAITSRAVSMLKKMTGGDLISTDVKYMPRVSFMNTAKLLFASNHAVISDSRDEAFLSRLVVLPFSRTVPPCLQDFDLGHRFAAERDAIIVKALDYYKALRSHNYIFSGNFPANMAIEGFDDALSCLVAFLKNRCQTDDAAWTATQDLYQHFCAKFGARWTMITFSERINSTMHTVYPQVEKQRRRKAGNPNPIAGFRGIRLRTEGWD